MKEYKGYLIDLDGTMYKGTELIAEARDFVIKLKEKGIPYLFVTNNSTKTPDKVAEKLEAFGIPATEEQVFTTSQATANYLHERKANASAYVIGGEGIRHALLEKGFTIEEEDTDFVVVGLDQEITYEKLAKACLNVRNGAFLFRRTEILRFLLKEAYCLVMDLSRPLLRFLLKQIQYLLVNQKVLLWSKPLKSSVRQKKKQS